MLPSTLSDFIRTFYGYGNPAGPIWLIGMEEGGGESEAEVARRLQVWQSLGCPETADLAEFHRHLGMPQFFSHPTTLQHTWAYLISLLLTSERGTAPDVASVKAYQRDHLGRLNGKTCLLELLPLPSPSTNTWNYGRWTGLVALRSRATYRQTYLPVRIRHLRSMILRHRPKVVAFYGATYRRWYEQVAGCAFTTSSEAGEPVYAKKDDSLYIILKHPAAWGSSQEYIAAGLKIRAWFAQNPNP